MPWSCLTLVALAVILLPLGSRAAPDLGLPSLQQAQPGVVNLGRQLFFDRRLSSNGTLSCAMCHIPEQGFAQNQLSTPVGLEGRAVKRNSPTLLNVAYMDLLFHDGREFSLENQIWSPLLSMREMGNPSVGWVLKRVSELDDYAGQFNRLLGGLNTLTLGIALAAYQRSLVAADSPFDRWYYGGDRDAVNASVKRGFSLFRNLGCDSCHQVGESYALFHDNRFHSTGIGWARSMAAKPGTREIRLDDTVIIKTAEEFEGEVFNDLGRYEVTGIASDRWKYRTPGLRNIALTAPYMHDGSLPTLEDVIRHYMAGGTGAPDQDPRIRSFDLDTTQIRDLVAFLESLTSHRVPGLIEEARAVAIGD